MSRSGLKRSPNFKGGFVITLKGVLFGIGLSAFGTFAYVVFLIWERLRGTPFFNSGVGLDITALKHDTYVVPGFWLFVLGLMLTGIGIVALWPRPVV